MGDWEHAKLMIQWVSALGVQPASYRAVGDALAEDVSARLASISLAAYPQKGRGPYALDAPVRAQLGPKKLYPLAHEPSSCEPHLRAGY